MFTAESGSPHNLLANARIMSGGIVAVFCRKTGYIPNVPFITQKHV